MRIFIFFFLFSLCFSGAALAKYSNVETCINCSVQQKEWKANNYALRDSPIGISEVHVLDLANYGFTSFEVQKYLNPTYPMHGGQQYFINLVEKPTPVELISISNGMIASNRDIEVSTSASSIPVNVLGDPWEYVNCAYCANNIESYVREVGTVTGAIHNMEHFLRVLGVIDTGIPNLYEMSLASGGRVRFSLQVANNGRIAIKIEKVIDANNNTVPPFALGLNNLNIQIGGQITPEGINQFLVPLGYFIPLNIPMGRVTIKDCPEAAVPGQPC